MKTRHGQREARPAARAVEVRRAPRRGVASRLTTAYPLPTTDSRQRPGLTLIELLVTIAILVTVLGGVVPMMSPNNDARKIREASRQLNGMLAQAQAQAARDGRPVGVAFREFTTSSTRSGMALEAFFIAEPKPYAGFSPNSRASVHVNTQGTLPPNVARAGSIVFVLAGTIGGSSVHPELPPDDPVPPNTIRRGDIVEVGGARYRIVEEDQDGDGTSDLDNNGDGDFNDPEDFKDGDYYTLTAGPKVEFQCVAVDFDPTSLRSVATAPPLKIRVATASGGFVQWRPFVINRQPRNTSDAPLQFPTGIGIDLQASSAEGSNQPATTIVGTPPETNRTLDERGTVNTIGIMFEPNGTLGAFYYDGWRYERKDHIYLLLGRFENGNNGNQDSNDHDFRGTISDDELAQRRGRLNWLNADSRWVAINRAGRIITAENNISFDPRHANFVDTSPNDGPGDQRRRQINAARNLAENMTSEGGR